MFLSPVVGAGGLLLSPVVPASRRTICIVQPNGDFVFICARRSRVRCDS